MSEFFFILMMLSILDDTRMPSHASSPGRFQCSAQGAAAWGLLRLLSCLGSSCSWGPGVLPARSGAGGGHTGEQRGLQGKALLAPLRAHLCHARALGGFRCQYLCVCRFSDCAWPCHRPDVFSFAVQTLVIKVSGVILSVVGGLAVGKVTEPERCCLGRSPSALCVLAEPA